jgi:predicted membrane protein
LEKLQNTKQADLVNALNALAVLVDVAKREPMLILIAGLALLLVGLLGVL